MASLIYDSFMDDLCKGNIVPSSDTFYGMLVTSSYTPSKGSDTKRSNVTNETSGTGYTAGGTSVAVTLTSDTTLHKETIAFADAVWTSSSITAAAIVVYKHRGGLSSADNLVCYGDFGGSVTTSSGTFTAHNSTAIAITN
ncbi:MAG TPA: hypothetical protein VIJ94_10285 [Caulobacteraceae bacterium]